jgi:cellulose biosynthesis protein BcsQ
MSYGDARINVVEHEESVRAKRVINISGLVPEQYDYVLLDPPSLPTTITFKVGGASGTIIATLVLTYVGTDLESVSRV